MIDCKKTENYLKERKRMCEKNQCDECTLGSNSNGTNKTCRVFENDYPSTAIGLVQKWSNENPPKTFLTDLLEKYPDVPLAKNGYPSICPHHLGYTKEDYINCGSSTCQQCWNTPVVEESEVKK